MHFWLCCWRAPVGACGRLGFDASAIEPDGGAVDGQPDAAMPIPIPMPMAFAPGSLIAELNLDGAETDDPGLTSDQLEVIFASSREGAGDLFRSVRSDVGAAWDLPTTLDQLNSIATESTLSSAPSGRLLLFSSDAEDPNGDLYLASRLANGGFGAPVRLTELNSSANDSASWISDDGLEVLLIRIDPTPTATRTSTFIAQPGPLFLTRSQPRRLCPGSMARPPFFSHPAGRRSLHHVLDWCRSD